MTSSGSGFVLWNFLTKRASISLSFCFSLSASSFSFLKLWVWGAKSLLILLFQYSAFLWAIFLSFKYSSFILTPSHFLILLTKSSLCSISIRSFSVISKLPFDDSAPGLFDTNFLHLANSYLGNIFLWLGGSSDSLSIRCLGLILNFSLLLPTISLTITWWVGWRREST